MIPTPIPTDLAELIQLLVSAPDDQWDKIYGALDTQLSPDKSTELFDEAAYTATGIRQRLAARAGLSEELRQLDVHANNAAAHLDVLLRPGGRPSRAGAMADPIARIGREIRIANAMFAQVERDETTTAGGVQ
jgi:hypothetical protein